jgi:hypothetical protein
MAQVVMRMLMEGNQNLESFAKRGLAVGALVLFGFSGQRKHFNFL